MRPTRRRWIRSAGSCSTEGRSRCIFERYRQPSILTGKLKRRDQKIPNPHLKEYTFAWLPKARDCSLRYHPWHPAVWRGPWSPRMLIASAFGPASRKRVLAGDQVARQPTAAPSPAFGFPADWRMAASNCAMSSLQGPAWATGMLKQSIAQTIGAVVPRSFDIGPRLPNCSTWRHQWPGHYSPNLTACTQVGTSSGNGNHDVAGNSRIALERAPERRRTDQPAHRSPLLPVLRAA